MPTKRELLEEKTVGDLKQMARDKDLSGYSNLRKAELIDMIDSNYKKTEIESWPEAEEEAEEIKPVEAVEREEIWETEPTEGVGAEEVEEVETLEVGKELERISEPEIGEEPRAFKQTIIGIIIGLVIIAVILTLWGAGAI